MEGAYCHRITCHSFHVKTPQGCMSDFDEFVLKIAPNRGSEFGMRRKMSYLCIV